MFPHNVSVGNNSLAANIGGAENTALGYTALNKNVSGIRNVSVGFSSLFNNLGSGNIGIGYASLYEGTTGVDNTIIGNNTGRGITTGTKNTILGANVIGLTATLSNNIIIADGDGNQRIRVLANGNVGIGVTAPTSKLQVTGLVEYASDAAAGTAGLTTGAFYHTAGTVKIKL